MQTATATIASSEARVQQHFDREARLYVAHALPVYQQSVAQRLDMIEAHSPFAKEDPIALLDVGCGGGAFLDMFLERFFQASAVGIDVSSSMLSGNKAHRRKALLQGDALALAKELGCFDVIAIDTVLHHLIDSRSYRSTQRRIQQCLASLHKHLRPGGIVVVREIYHEFKVLPTFGSRAIFAATTLKLPKILERMMKSIGLQTANAGVCFQTRDQWPKLFAESGFTVVAAEDRAWPGQPYRRFGFAQSGDLHYVLSHARPSRIGNQGAHHA